MKRILLLLIIGVRASISSFKSELFNVARVDS